MHSAVGKYGLTASLLGSAALAALQLFPLVALADADPVIVAAGDIACDPDSTQYNGGLGTATDCKQLATSDLWVGDVFVSRVLTLGDNQYEKGELADFSQSFDSTWGRGKSLIRPAPGNHDYATAGAAGYFDYFNGLGAADGPAGEREKGYYSFDIGAWHLIALNSNIDRTPSSIQVGWLRSDLAAHSNDCTLAYWHHPRFNSGGYGNNNTVAPFWEALQQYKADVVLVGHEHLYERFAPQANSAAADPQGIRQFTVGTGGKNYRAFGVIQPNSQARGSTHGVLRLTLHPDGYDWSFTSIPGYDFSDSGTGACVKGEPGPGDSEPPTVPTGLTASATSSTSVKLSWTAATDNSVVAAYTVYRDGVELGTSPFRSFTDGTAQPSTTYSYTVDAVDAANNRSAQSAPATITTPEPSAPGSTVEVSGTALKITSQPGAASDLTFSSESATYRVHDAGASLIAGIGCTQVSANEVSCQQVGSTAITALKVTAGDLDDAATVTSNTKAVLDGGPGNDTLTGGAVADTLTGNAGDDTLIGGAGNDTFAEGATASGADYVDGGLGADTAGYGPRRDPVVVDTDGVADDGAAGEGDNVQGTVEKLTGGKAGDTLTGSTTADTLTGNAGDDTLDGQAGADRFSGGPGDDTIEARHGDRDSKFQCGDSAAIVDNDTVNADSVPDDPVTASATNCEVVNKESVAAVWSDLLGPRALAVSVLELAS